MATTDQDSPPGEGQPDTGQRSWSLVLRSGMENKRIPAALPKNDEFGNREKLDYKTIWEEPDIADKIIARKAAAILQCATYTEAVYFEFRKQDFDHYTDAYRLIEKELGRLKGVRRVTRYSHQTTTTLMVEVQFMYPADRKTAITKGLTFNNIQYRGTPANDGLTDKLVRVSLSQLPYFLPDDVLVKDLLAGLRRYGKVCQLKKITNRGYFEGDVIALLDIKPMENLTWLPLERRLYLEPWDMAVSAAFRGAPPVCFGCKESGHIRENCPKMANVRCYNCKGKGHYARRCKEKTRTETEAMDNFVKDQASKDIKTAQETSDEDETMDAQVTKEDESKDTQEEETHQELTIEGMTTETMEEDDEPTQEEEINDNMTITDTYLTSVPEGLSTNQDQQETKPEPPKKAAGKNIKDTGSIYKSSQSNKHKSSTLKLSVGSMKAPTTRPNSITKKKQPHRSLLDTTHQQAEPISSGENLDLGTYSIIPHNEIGRKAND